MFRDQDHDDYDPNDDEPRWLSALYLFGWLVLWLFVAVIMLACIFGGILYTWQG